MNAGMLVRAISTSGECLVFAAMVVCMLAGGCVGRPAAPDFVWESEYVFPVDRLSDGLVGDEVSAAVCVFRAREEDAELFDVVLCISRRDGSVRVDGEILGSFPVRMLVGDDTVLPMQSSYVGGFILSQMVTSAYSHSFRIPLARGSEMPRAFVEVNGKETLFLELPLADGRMRNLEADERMRNALSPCTIRTEESQPTLR